MKVRGGELSGASFPGTGHVDASRDRAAQLTGHGRLVRVAAGRAGVPAETRRHARSPSSPTAPPAATPFPLFPCQLPLKWR